MGEDTKNGDITGSFVGQVRNLYETFPYPATFNDNPGRAIRSGSLLPAIDHYIFDGVRDFSKPMRILVAGCGTGDALMDLGSQALANRVPAEFMAVDLSEASLGIARERAARIGLTNIRFECKRLEELDPAKDGPFDYIDCSGVLHHLDDPSIGLNALAACLTDDGGICVMVYGTLGRTGVYDVQRIISMLDAGPVIDQERVDRARALLGDLPRRNRLMTNPLFQEASRFRDDEIADAFLNPRDRSYTVPEIRAFLNGADLDAVSFLPPFAYEPKFMLPAGTSRDQAAALSWWEQRELAELLSGTMRKHSFYAKRTAAAGSEGPPLKPVTVPSPVAHMLSPILENRDGETGRSRFKYSSDGLDNVMTLPISDDEAAMLSLVDGKTTLGEIKSTVAPEASWRDFADAFQITQTRFTALGMLFLSGTIFI